MTNYRILPPGTPPEERAARIRQLLQRAFECESKAGRRRWEAGLELIEARKVIPHGEWEDWCKVNLHRSPGDIRKIIAMAAAKDPELAHEAEQAKGREREAAVREKAKRSHVRVSEEEQIEYLFKQWQQLSQSGRAQLLKMMQDASENVVPLHTRNRSNAS